MTRALPTIRAYCEGDLTELRRITVECFEPVSVDRRIEELHGVINGRDWRWRKARHIDADIAAHAEGVWVADPGSGPVGYVSSRVDHDTRIGWIPNLAVLPEWRGIGLGRALLELCCDRLRDAGMEYVRIETLTHNDVGSRLYPSVGFQEVARQIHFVKRLV